MIVKILSGRYLGLIILSVLAALIICAATSFAVTIDVTDYGADGSDLVDDKAEIQSAIADLSDNDTLLFPETSGAYRVEFEYDNNLYLSYLDGIKIVIRGKILATGTPNSKRHVFDVFNCNDMEFSGEGGGGVLEGSDQYTFGIDDIDGSALVRQWCVSGASRSRSDQWFVNAASSAIRESQVRRRKPGNPWLGVLLFCFGL